MTTVGILITIAFIAISIVQFLIFNSKLNKERKEKESYAEDNKLVRENYRTTIEQKDKEFKTLSNNLKIATDTSKSWKDSSDGKQDALDNAHLKIDLLIKLFEYYKVNWAKELVVIEENSGISYPALRLSYKSDVDGYSAVTYQGSKDLTNKFDFLLSLSEEKQLGLLTAVRTITNTFNPTESKEIQEIINFLNKNNG